MLSARRVGRVVSTLFFTAGLLFAALLMLTALMGWQRYAITSGSMAGAYDRGTLVLDEVVPVASLEVGDVITYTPPADSYRRGLLTHRIHAIGADPRGRRIYRTKGDANVAPDPWTFGLEGPDQARVRLGIPFVGYPIQMLSDRRLRIVLIAVPAALIAFSTLAGLWRSTGPGVAAARS